MLLANGHHVVTSLAGVTENPLLPPGEIRRGGFGGDEGLVNYLGTAHIRLLIDATHPFAAIMSQHASAAAHQTALPLLRLERPPWKQGPDEQWIRVSNMAKAIAVLPVSAKALVTTGRKNLAELLARQDLGGVIRSIEPINEKLPMNWQLVLDRPPHDLASEIALMQQFQVTHLLTKNAGGDKTAAKLLAAHRLGIAVVMIDRPLKPACWTYTSAVEVVAAFRQLVSAGGLVRVG